MIDSMLNIAVFVACILFALVYLIYKKKVKSLQIHSSTEHRDKVNKKYPFKLFGIIIVGFSFACYALAVAGVIQATKGGAFTVVVSILLLLPFSVMATGLYGILTFVMHLLNPPKKLQENEDIQMKNEF